MNKLNNKMSVLSSLMFFNIGFDEDGGCGVEEGKLEGYKWKGYLSNDGMCGICEDVDMEGKNFVKDDDVDGKEELVKFEEGKKKFDVLREMFGGVVLSWSVEYDINWILIYSEDGKDVEEVVEKWLEREVDDSEFDGF